jgi:hypothetical protein
MRSGLILEFVLVTKKLELFDNYIKMKGTSNPRTVNIIYNGTRIHENISEEKTTELLLELAEKCYDGLMDFDQIEIEYVA